MNQAPYILENPPKRHPVSDKRTYNVSIQTSIIGVEKPVKKTITYLLDISYENHFFSFIKGKTTVDGAPVPTKINELYLKATESLNAIEFRCTEQGNVNELYKYRHLLKKWEQVKSIIKKEFTGASVDQLITRLDVTYNNKQTLIQRINSNIVLQTFYRSFLNDYLVYYGKSRATFNCSGILGNNLLPFASEKTLSLKNEQLYVQTDASLNKAKINTEQLEAYFKNKVEGFNLDNLEISIQDCTLLDYKSVWINQSTVTKIVQVGNYKKQVILTLQNV
ncbi:hypothetical protein JM658_10895 [Joostella atrarenae]|uniref:Uncharacterized protein n=1 Tax=Joostella atrarenae TaxID=679257 RepID=A0ABS9J4N6_9FLAO|nr:hypothetical protein [Joostella atrarenae]MCF8715335.1 hypothetical protein [Joostella atrarenae]